MGYSDEELEEISNRIDLIDYIEQTEELHRKGDKYFIKCPFHQGDDTPSLCIYPKSQSWYCFGCGKGGKIFQWIQYKEKISFNQAVERVFKILGIEDEYKQRQHYVDTPTVRFFKFLKKQKNESGSQDMIKRTILDYQKDYVDKYSDDIPVEWVNEGMKPDVIRLYDVRIDYGSNRIVYPVFDSEGQFISVKGRTRIKDFKLLGLQKYINYQKIGTIDYFQGWQLALPEICNSKKVIIFEGVKSCIKAWGWNVKNTIAAETSKLSEGQLKLLIKQGFDEVIIGWDNDKTLQSIISDQKIQMLKKFTKVTVIVDRNKKLDPKMAPVDKGEQVFMELLDGRYVI